MATTTRLFSSTAKKMAAAPLKLLTFTVRTSANPASQRVGALVNDRVLDVSSMMGVPDMLSFIEGGSSSLTQLQSILDQSPSKASEFMLDISDISIKAPIPSPRRNIICVGKNYMDHVAEVLKAGGTGEALTDMIPKVPVFFTKAPETVIEPHGKVESHANLTKWLDYEAELAVVIGKKGRDIPVDSAMEYVFGYTIGNDVTARDVQKRHNQWFKGKSLDSTCPMGPVIVPAAGLDPSALSVKMWVNGELRQSSSTANMIFGVPAIIHHLSQGMTLYPGDIVLTGTPDGVGFAMDPPQMLRSGDSMKIEIEGIGVLENSVV